MTEIKQRTHHIVIESTINQYVDIQYTVAHYKGTVWLSYLTHTVLCQQGGECSAEKTLPASPSSPSVTNNHVT